MSSKDYIIIVRSKTDNVVSATRFSNNVNQRIKYIKQSILGNTPDSELKDLFGGCAQSDIEFLVCPITKVLPF